MGRTNVVENIETENWEVWAGVSTWQVAAQDLHPHADTSRRPPLRENPDVLRYDLLEASHLWRVVVAVSLENLSRINSRERPVTL